MSDKPTVFISYSHKDEPDNPTVGEEKWLTFVQKYLAPAVKGGRFELWVDRHLTGGADLDPEIERKLQACDVFVLLVSTNSMASDYIVDTEIRIIRERQANGENALFYPIVLMPTPKIGKELVQDKNLRPRDGKPLSAFGAHDRAERMSEIADEIADHAATISGLRAAQQRPKPEHQVGILVDISRLPETPYVNLVGRGAELEKLENAWKNPQINIISAIAEGGAGKSALINDWLKRLQQRNYASAEAVLGWSFYSQGSKERATSADSFLDWVLSKLGIALQTNSSSAKGEAIADALAGRRILLVLDGVEPLQHGPGSEFGKLKDQGLRALLRRFAAAPSGVGHGLIAITSRAEIVDLKKWGDASSQIIDVEKLSDEAGAALLKDNGIWGTDSILKAASTAFGGHALAISLLAGYLKEARNGDVRQKDNIRALIYDPENPRHDHARRVMESYAEEWLSSDAVMSAIMYLVGLFDRPADHGCLGALRQEPVIEGLTEPLINLASADWNKVVYRLREARLLLPMDESAPESLDAHPLVREWFGERLRRTNETAWRSAHSRLYEHLCDTTKEGIAPTVENFAPLFQAVAHGCRANRHQEAFDNVYVNRICRRYADGALEFYLIDKLGAFSANLAVISWFFTVPYETPSTSLRPAHQSWVLANASSMFAVQGRIREALPGQQAAMNFAIGSGDWNNASRRAAHLSNGELTSGNIDAAISLAEKSIEYADRSKDNTEIVLNRATLASALRARGNYDEAHRLFADAEQRQMQVEANELLYSFQGYEYCDLLLDQGKWAEVCDRAAKIIEIGLRNSWLLDIGLGKLAISRAHLGSALECPPSRISNQRNDIRSIAQEIDEEVGALRVSGLSDELPRGLAASAVFRRLNGDWRGSTLNLDEIEEIAEPGPMRLYLCDLAIERARLAFARIETFAPLNGFLEFGNPPKPVVPIADEIKEFKKHAKEQIAVAKQLIAECGYHMRDAELAELEDVLSGKRRFADLPPHV
jgi:tetratricopeptide (TPR) repeat protein